MMQELSLFDIEPRLFQTQMDVKKIRSGSFIDNMKLPVHRWFRYSAGFSAEWVKDLLRREHCRTVMDPFAGSGTVNIVADEMGITSFGYEAQPFVVRIARAKTFWDADIHEFAMLCKAFLSLGQRVAFDDSLLENTLLERCFDQNVLKRLLQVRAAWESMDRKIDNKLSGLAFLAITAVLRSASHAGTAQWQYIQPRKMTKAVDPDEALRVQFSNMLEDMRHMRRKVSKSRATVYHSDSRSQDALEAGSIDLVVTSPPYANNYDYADATRFEMTFWGEISGWGELHEKARKNLICSSSQHAAREHFVLDERLASPLLAPIRGELTAVCEKLAKIRLTKGGKKHYHTMIASYFADMAQVIHGLHRVLRQGGKAVVVIGDSAPYGIYVPVEEWFGKIALHAGFSAWTFEKLRDRNTKWKNRKHDVALKEGVLCLKN